MGDERADTGDDDDLGWSLVCPFWIDTDAYTRRDQEMFCAGYEFAGVIHHVRHDPAPLSTTIHRENESRVRMACGRFGRSCSIDAVPSDLDPDGTWSSLEIGPAS